MDWLRKVPIGQYVTGKRSWIRKIDPRLRMAWMLLFLISPVLAGPTWRISLVLTLVFITFSSRLPIRIWWRSLLLVIALSIVVGFFAMLLPTNELPLSFDYRDPNEIISSEVNDLSWYLYDSGTINWGRFQLGPLLIDRRTAELGINASSLVFTVIHSVNIVLITTSPEDLIWALRWFISPLGFLGLPVERICFQLLLSLRFLPLVQEELQNLLRSLSTRAVNLRKLGFKSTISLFLALGEKLLSNILLRAEQGADALSARGGHWLPVDDLRVQKTVTKRALWLNIISASLLVFALCLRGKYGAL